MLKKIQARSDEATTQDQLEEIARGVAGVAYGSKNTLPILFLFDYIFLSLAGTDTVNIYVFNPSCTRNSKLYDHHRRLERPRRSS